MCPLSKSHRQSRPHRLSAPCVRRRLHGYTLLELTVAGSVAAVVTAGALLTLQFNERMTAGKIVAEHMLRLSCLLYTSPSPRD